MQLRTKKESVFDHRRTLNSDKAFIRAVTKLQIASYVVDSIIDVHLTSLKPLRGWALAVRFNRPESRQWAVRKLIRDTNDPLAVDLVELENVSARAFARLLYIKRETVNAIRMELSELIWTRTVHASLGDWYKDQQAIIDEAPFDPSNYSDSALQTILDKHSCAPCFQRFRSAKATSQRAFTRSSVRTLADKAVKEEAQSQGKAGITPVYLKSPLNICKSSSVYRTRSGER